jgi:Xaa-Pro aminopeptidase
MFSKQRLPASPTNQIRMLDVRVKAPEASPADVPKTAAHDDGPPQALLDFMVTEWEPRERSAAPVAGLDYAARRRALSERFPNDVVIVATGHQKVRANDTFYRFRPGTDFFYLTGNTEPDGVLVFVPQRGAGHRVTLYVAPNPGKTDATFFTDRVAGELWVGPRLGVDESAARYGIPARALAVLDAEFTSLAEGAHAIRVLRGIDPLLDGRFGEASEGDGELASFLSELRLIKDSREVAELEKAIAATKNGFEDVLRALPGSKTERFVEGVFNLRARIEGNDVGYGTIAAAGSHACTLHWTSNDGALRPGDLLLLDAGVETDTLYTADITRTVPIDGRFSPEQREIYELVLAAQDAGFAACMPGNDFLAPNAAAMQVLARGLERLGILPMSAEEALRETNQFYKRYSLHNVSHMLGLDVHDCAKARQETYRYGKLASGMVLTVEPGLYFQPDDRTVPARYRSVGVRIEDDVVITPDGHRVLSAGIPRETDAVERWVRDCANAPSTLFGR